MYCSSNSILNNFSMLYSNDIKKLHNTFSNVCNSKLLECINKCVELINIAYRKVTRRLYKLPDETHKCIVNALGYSIETKLHRKTAKFIYNMINNDR